MKRAWPGLVVVVAWGCDPARLPIDDPPTAVTASTAATATTGLGGTGHTGRPTGTTPADRFLAELGERGITADEGVVSWSAMEDCCVRGNCLLVNEGSDYGTWALPPSPGEYVEDREPDGQGRTESWRLGVDEGALYVGPRPPGARYVSFRSYVHDRAGPEGGRVFSFANLGDTLNDRVFTENDDGTVLVLTTAHAGLAERVRRAAAAVGWPEVGLDVVPSTHVRLGVDAPADTFHVTLRVVGFDDRSAFDAFRDGAGARVFKLRPTARQPADPLPTPEERAAVPAPPAGTSAAVASLRQAVIGAHPGWQVVDAVVNPLEPPLDPSGDEPFCWAGCNRDVSYSTTAEAWLLPGDRLVVYGVDPVSLGRATWTEVMLAGLFEEDAAGHAGTDDLAGSARAWQPTAPDGLYAFTFARDCAGIPHCQVVPTSCPGLSPLEPGSILWRHYLDPATDTWPPLAGLGERGAMHLRPPPPG